MSAIAYLFILTTYLAAKKNFWSDVGEDPGSDPAVATEIDRTLSLLPLDIQEKMMIIIKSNLVGRRRHCPRSSDVPESAGRASYGLVPHFDEG